MRDKNYVKWNMKMLYLLEECLKAKKKRREIAKELNTTERAVTHAVERYFPEYRITYTEEQKRMMLDPEYTTYQLACLFNRTYTSVWGWRKRNLKGEF